MPKPKFYHLYLQRDGLDLDTLSIIRREFAGARQLGHVKPHALRDGVPLLDGFTICKLVDDDGNELARGYAFCSTKDQFCRRTGRMIAEGRAMARLKERRPILSEHASEFDATQSLTMGWPDSPVREDGSPKEMCSGTMAAPAVLTPQQVWESWP